ncbi:lipopolysaccharide biosynthesis protein [Hutsoniella sourekii]|uniref:lipopolysaccharide biosynthesis protein n=1 Tax=Hutsoniella sourekii TaxID=87650 RepID=UPI00048260F3|nr:polysaccharide biosynthesis C-terminal domain-containing protein [Hutsoniella sourekii]
MGSTSNLNNLKFNSVAALVYQAVVIISGLIIPRFILKFYGSETNGLQASVSQFLSVINFLELGVGSVVQSALYKPLYESNMNLISEILSAAQSYFKKIAAILIIYVIILLVLFPNIINSPLNDISTGLLIIAMSISQFSQFYFGLTNQLLLNADQRNYVQISASIVTVILNTALTVFFIYLKFSIVTVKFISAFVFLLRPLFLKYYVSKHYQISLKEKFTSNSIPQKWNGMAQHIAYVVLDSTDIIVLTVFSTLESVSIYTIYNLVVNGLKQLVMSLGSGLQSFFGHYLARDNVKEALEFLNKIEWISHTIIVLLFSMTLNLIIPFIHLYTKGVNDVNYEQPLFALFIVLAQMVFCLRLPYSSIVLAGGHFKQTQNSAIIEATLNVVISIVLVNQFGLIGVAIGTLIAVSYRTLYLVNYLRNNLIYRPLSIFLKQAFIDVISLFILYFSANFINIKSDNFFQWIITAIILGLHHIVIILIINLMFFKDNILQLLKDY